MKKSKCLSVQDSRFIDEYGREVILHGVNLVCKDKDKNYIDDWQEDNFKQLRRWGLNVVRLGVIWDGLEPEPNAFNDEYIEQLRVLIRRAKKQDIFVILDMHQDLFSCAFADGAPHWATFTDGEEYEPGVTWSDAYLFNRAVQKAFDHFWRNTTASSGKGIQDHYGDAWKYLVHKLHTEENVIGYDIMNEPFIGSEALLVMDKMMQQYGQIYHSQYGKIDQEEIAAAFLDPNKKEEYFQLLEDTEAFQQLVDAPEDILKRFDQSILTPFFQKVATEIRTVDANGIIFLETNYFSNLGAQSTIKPILNQREEKDSQQAYAPHAYDLVVDTNYAHTANDRRLELIFARHEKTTQRLGLPMIFGEWGAFYNNPQTAHVSMKIKRLLEQLLASDTYWSYTPEMDQYAPFSGIRRAFPMAVAGRLFQYRDEEGIGGFQMKWREDLNEPTLIYFPNIQDIEQADISLSPSPSKYTIHRMKDSAAGYMEIPSFGKRIRHLVITKR